MGELANGSDFAPRRVASGGGNNLRLWNYRQHASHLAAVALYARDNWGVYFSTVEPFNEPSAAWWSSGGSQEGCHMDASVQSAVLPYMRGELDKCGLTSTRIAASDETNYDQARATWNQFGPAAKGYVDQVNVHGYQGSGGRRDLLYADVVTTAGKDLWNSENGDNDASGWSLANNLLLDFHSLHPTAWAYWQVLDPNPAWALIAYDRNTLEAGAVQPKYYVMAQFSRHIRPPLHHGGGRLGRPGPPVEHRVRRGGRALRLVLGHVSLRQDGERAARGEVGADPAGGRGGGVTMRRGSGV